MTLGFPRLEILPPSQRQLWDAFAEIPGMFTLYGGTAIALHLGHRQSIDFDFFASQSIDPQALMRDLAILRRAEIIQVAPDTLTVRSGGDAPVLVSFFGLPWLRAVERPLIAPGSGLKVAAMVDLAGTKMATVQARAEAKDYIDIDAMIASGIGLPAMLAAARAIHGTAFDPQATLKALTFFDDGNLASLGHELRLRLVTAVRAVDPGRTAS